MVPPKVMPTDSTERVAIVGGGFSGMMTAVNLVRLARQPLRVTLVNGSPTSGRGIAYGTRHSEHLLNVAARNMSAFRDEPDHFLQWLRTRTEYEAVPEAELRERFIPRQVYGDYVRSLAQHHLQSAGGLTPVQTACVTGEATDIEPMAGGVAVRLADGNTVEADRVVLATGNETPAALPGTDALTDHPAWAGDPWQPWERRLPAGHDGKVVILGTGLSAVDVIITLRAVGWAGRVHAVSRHGWVPHAHFRGVEYPEFPPPGVDLAALGLEGLAALVQKHCAALHARNAHPAIIVDKLRPHTQRIWSRFTREERLKFVQEHAARWNVFRHRIAPELHAQVTNAQLTGQLQVHATGIETVEGAGDRIRVRLQNGKDLDGDLVINATGPASRLKAIRSTLLQNLLRRGLIAPDETDMGVRVDEDFTVIDAAGRRSEYLLALGPPLRGTLWETVAVPELRGQARRVAETLLDHPPGTPADFPPTMEYMI